MMDTGWRRTLEAMLGVPATEGNRVEILRNGVEIFPSMLEAISAAERSIDLLTFVYWTGDIAEVFAYQLAERASEGVRVRVLLDAFGARKLDDRLVRHMLDSGVDVRWFRPIDGDDIEDLPNRTHRKVLVCDERIGFTGGVGIAEEWTGDAEGPGEWRDTHVRVEGPAVDGIRAAFIDNWFEASEEIFDGEIDTCAAVPGAGDYTVQVLRGSAGAAATAIGTLQTLLVEQARERIRIAAAYFSPSERVLRALHRALDRGVAVDIVLPGPHADKGFMRVASESVFGELIEAGANICTFQPSMLHCKVIIVDDRVASTGSANFDDRAVQHDDEINLVLFDAPLVQELVEHFEDDMSRSEPIDFDDWVERGLLQRAKERIVDTVDGLL
jgi:cardiolipin synthase A/B